LYIYILIIWALPKVGLSAISFAKAKGCRCNP
jgi:hypothetical protein